MESKLTHRGYAIPYTLDNHNSIKNDLMVKPFVLPDYDFNNEPFPVYRRNTEYIYIPKYYGIQKYGTPTAINERDGDNINLIFNGKLTELQIGVSNKIIDTISKNDSAVLSLSTGMGKTVLGLYTISLIKKKTLIIVHKEFLLNQWIERIKQFLPNARIGIIQQNKVDTDDKDIVIAMLQSITVRKIKYPKETFDSFGYTLIDECHRICSRTFSKALFQIATKKSLGLSATPDRKDGLTKVLNWFLGDTITFGVSNEELKPEVIVVKAEYSDPQPTPTYNMLGKINLPNLVTQISLDTIRNIQIIKEIIYYFNINKDNKRRILVLTERRLQCEQLLNMIPSEISGGLYVGGMKNDDLENSNTKDVIFATYAMAQEGYDNSCLDTLIFATGRSDIVQACGRILRKKNINHPLIIDFQDNIEGLYGQAKKRLNYYKSKKYKITHNNNVTNDDTTNQEQCNTFMFLEDDDNN